MSASESDPTQPAKQLPVAAIGCGLAIIAALVSLGIAWVALDDDEPRPVPKSSASETTNLVVRITDIDGDEIDITNPKADYTRYGLVYVPNWISSGLQRKDDEKISWGELERLELTYIPGQNDPQVFARAWFKDMRIERFQLKALSKGGLEGETPHGRFSIPLSNVKRLDVRQKKVAVDANPVSRQMPPSSEVLDESGTTTLIGGPSVDYSIVPDNIAPGSVQIVSLDTERDGLRAVQGKGQLLIPWWRVEQVTIGPVVTTGEGKDEHKTIQATVQYRSGVKRVVALLPSRREHIGGSSTHGVFEYFNLQRVKTLRPTNHALERAPTVETAGFEIETRDGKRTRLLHPDSGRGLVQSTGVGQEVHLWRWIAVVTIEEVTDGEDVFGTAVFHNGDERRLLLGKPDRKFSDLSDMTQAIELRNIRRIRMVPDE